MEHLCTNHSGRFLSINLLLYLSDHPILYNLQKLQRITPQLRARRPGSPIQRHHIAWGVLQVEANHEAAVPGGRQMTMPPSVMPMQLLQAYIRTVLGICKQEARPALLMMLIDPGYLNPRKQMHTQGW